MNSFFFPGALCPHQTFEKKHEKRAGGKPWKRDFMMENYNAHLSKMVFQREYDMLIIINQSRQKRVV